jgi:hypothetical protein
VIAKGNVAVVGNANQASSGGTFTVVDPTKAITSTTLTVPFMPNDLVPAVSADGTGVDFFACPYDGVSSCSPFALPK